MIQTIRMALVFLSFVSIAGVARAQLPFKVSIGPQVGLTWSRGTHQNLSNADFHYVQKNAWNSFPFGAWGMVAQLEVLEKYRLNVSWLNKGILSNDLLLQSAAGTTRLDMGFQARNWWHAGIAYKLWGFKAPFKSMKDWGLDFWLGAGIQMATTPRYAQKARHSNNEQMANDFIINSNVQNLEKTNTSVVLDFSTQLTYLKHKMVWVGLRYAYAFKPTLTVDARIGNKNDSRIDFIRRDAGNHLLHFYIAYPIKVYSNVKKHRVEK